MEGEAYSAPGNGSQIDGLDLFLLHLKMEGEAYSAPGNGNQIDGKVLQTFQKSSGQVQSSLDQNRLLINEINQNHESKIPDNLSRNVSLIRELNNNISRLVDLSIHLIRKDNRNIFIGRFSWDSKI